MGDKPRRAGGGATPFAEAHSPSHFPFCSGNNPWRASPGQPGPPGEKGGNEREPPVAHAPCRPPPTRRNRQSPAPLSTPPRPGRAALLHKTLPKTEPWLRALTSCVTLVKSLTLPDPQVPRLQNRGEMAHPQAGKGIQGESASKGLGEWGAGEDCPFPIVMATPCQT